MCYQRCESTADGLGLETECRGHCSRSVMAQREKGGGMKGDGDREGHHVGHLSLLFLSILFGYIDR